MVDDWYFIRLIIHLGRYLSGFGKFYNRIYASLIVCRLTDGRESLAFGGLAC